MSDGFTLRELGDAISAADEGDWEPLERFTQEKHILDPNRKYTCVYMRAIPELNKRIGYHRGLGIKEEWWFTVTPLFASEHE